VKGKHDMKKLQWTKRRVNPRQLSARIPPHGGYIITEAPGVVEEAFTQRAVRIKRERKA
jgi:hypothetical protein